MKDYCAENEKNTSNIFERAFLNVLRIILNQLQANLITIIDSNFFFFFLISKLIIWGSILLLPLNSYAQWTKVLVYLLSARKEYVPLR